MNAASQMFISATTRRVCLAAIIVAGSLIDVAGAAGKVSAKAATWRTPGRVLASSTPRPPSVGSLTVRIVDPSGEPAPKATFELYSNDCTIYIQGSVNASGLVTIETLPPGNYLVIAFAPDGSSFNWMMTHIGEGINAVTLSTQANAGAGKGQE